MYVQVLLIKMRRRATGVAATSALLSEWHKSRCSSEIGVQGGKRSTVTKFSQTSTSETQSKWLVQKSSSFGEGQIPPRHHLGYTKRGIALYYSSNTVFFLCLHTGYCLVIVMQGSLIRAAAHQKVQMVRC